jgi:hypothetical protein
MFCSKFGFACTFQQLAIFLGADLNLFSLFKGMYFDDAKAQLAIGSA